MSFVQKRSDRFIETDAELQPGLTVHHKITANFRNPVTTKVLDRTIAVVRIDSKHPSKGAMYNLINCLKQDSYVDVVLSGDRAYEIKTSSQFETYEVAPAVGMVSEIDKLGGEVQWETN